MDFFNHANHAFCPNLEARECTIVAHTLHQAAHMQQLRLSKMFDQRLRLGDFADKMWWIEAAHLRKSWKNSKKNYDRNEALPSVCF